MGSFEQCRKQGQITLFLGILCMLIDVNGVPCKVSVYKKEKTLVLIQLDFLVGADE